MAKAGSWSSSLVALTSLAIATGCGQDLPERIETPEMEAGSGTAPSFDSVPIAFDAAGTGETALVFVHGWSCDRSYWSAQVEPFSQDFRVVTLDLAGHGESGMDREGWTIAAYGVDVAAVVEQLGLDRVILVGHSMGGDVVVSAARLLKGRVLGIVWVDDYSQLGTFRTPDQVAEVIAPLRVNFADSTYALVHKYLFSPNADSALVERIARDMAAAPPHVALASLESSITNDRVVPSELEKLDLPVVSLNPAGSNPDVESLQQHGVEVILVPDVGHFMMMENPEVFNDILLNVVQGIVRDAGSAP